MFLIYNPVVGGFIPGGPDAAKVQPILDAARAQVGEADWKRGNTLNRPGGATVIVLSMLAEAGIKPIRPSGRLKAVSYAETKDAAGNTYQKVRVCLANEGESDIMVSVDVGSEVGERLIQKLAGVDPQAAVTISAFPVPAEDGRPYVNHVVSVKVAGIEVANRKGIYEAVKSKATQVRDALASAGVTDPKAVKAAVTNARKAESLQRHTDLAKEIEQRFKRPAAEGDGAAEAAPEEAHSVTDPV